MAYYNIGANTLASGYTPGGKFPFDAREIVATFDDLLDEGTFKSRVYEGMRVVVIDECCIYELVSTTTDGSNNKNNIINQFVEKIDETTDLSPNKKLWKRLNIETINANNDNDKDGALTRAKNNLVNGALIYIANDITLDDGTTQKSGLYFCQNVDGGGVLTMAGGEVTSEQFNELSDLVGSTSVSSQIESAVTTLNSAIGTKADQSALNELTNTVTDNKSEIDEALGQRYTKEETNGIIASYSTTAEMNDAINAAINTNILKVINETEF